MLLKRAVPITRSTTSPDLFLSLADVAADLMLETLAGLDAGTVRDQAQDETLATHAPILTREDGRIDWSRSAQQIDARFRGFQPWPGGFTTLRGKKLIVHAMRVTTTLRAQSPEAAGEVLIDGDASVAADLLNPGLLVVCGDGGVVSVDELQMEGKKRMQASEFLRGFQVKPGERLG